MKEETKEIARIQQEERAINGRASSFIAPEEESRERDARRSHRAPKLQSVLGASAREKARARGGGSGSQVSSVAEEGKSPLKVGAFFCEYYYLFIRTRTRVLLS